MRVHDRSSVLLIGVLAGLAGCRFVEDLQLRISPPPFPHEEYSRGLETSGLATTPVARQWLDAAATALGSPEQAEVPFQRSGWFAAEDPAALGLRIEVLERRWVSVTAQLEGEDSTRIFIDVFRVSDEPGEPLARIASAADTGRAVTFRSRRGDDIIVRIQPELLRGGAWEVIIAADEERPTASAGHSPTGTSVATAAMRPLPGVRQ